MRYDPSVKLNPNFDYYGMTFFLEGALDAARADAATWKSRARWLLRKWRHEEARNKSADNIIADERCEAEMQSAYADELQVRAKSAEAQLQAMTTRAEAAEAEFKRLQQMNNHLLDQIRHDLAQTGQE
jgi:hypothetical protein